MEPERFPPNKVVSNAWSEISSSQEEELNAKRERTSIKLNLSFTDDPEEDEKESPFPNRDPRLFSNTWLYDSESDQQQGSNKSLKSFQPCQSSAEFSKQRAQQQKNEAGPLKIITYEQGDDEDIFIQVFDKDDRGQRLEPRNCDSKNISKTADLQTSQLTHEEALRFLSSQETSGQQASQESNSAVGSQNSEQHSSRACSFGSTASLIRKVYQSQDDPNPFILHEAEEDKDYYGSQTTARSSQSRQYDPLNPTLSDIFESAATSQSTLTSYGLYCSAHSQDTICGNQEPEASQKE